MIDKLALTFVDNYEMSIKLEDINYEYLKKRIKTRQRLTFPQRNSAVLSAQKCLTSRFEMELGITTLL